jgi:hypothetical protein
MSGNGGGFVAVPGSTGDRPMTASASNPSRNVRPGIFEWTGLQFLRPAPRPSLSDLVTSEPANLDALFPLTLPRSQELPRGDASLLEIGNFIACFDPTRHFRELWGERYRDRIRTLWSDCVSAYRNGCAPAFATGELLLCLAYDWRLGPCLGVAEHEKLAFLRWLISRVRVGL